MTNNRSVLCRVALLALGSLAACSESEDPKPEADAGVSCDFDACDGNIEGRWEIDQTCLTSMMFPWCPSGFIDVGRATMEGGMVFHADGTYETTVSAKGVMTMSMPASCLAPGQTCTSLSESLLSQTGDDFRSVECSGTDLCTCVLTGQSQRKLGSYQRNGTQVIAAAPDSKGVVHTDTFDVCAQPGSSLWLRTAAGGQSPVLMSLHMRAR